MTPPEVLAALDELIRRRSILDHPFYRAWTAGTLSRADLAVYARIYYPHVAAFPSYLESAAARTADAEVRASLLDNLADERGNPAPHPELWLRFAEGVGADRQRVETGPPHAAAAATVTTFRRLCNRSTAAGLAALYAYESQQPEVAARKADGLRERYGVEDEATLAYFTVHSDADRRHRDEERRALARLLDHGSTRGSEILGAAAQALDAYWGLLDGVCTETGIDCPMVF